MVVETSWEIHKIWRCCFAIGWKICFRDKEKGGEESIGCFENFCQEFGKEKVPKIGGLKDDRMKEDSLKEGFDSFSMKENFA